MSLDMMKHNSLEEVVKEIDTSTSHRGAKRFESKTENGKTLVRACFCRNLELAEILLKVALKTIKTIHYRKQQHKHEQYNTSRVSECKF
jgi:hypothetical protein